VWYKKQGFLNLNFFFKENSWLKKC
jgi:hypothetical protein